MNLPWLRKQANVIPFTRQMKWRGQALPSRNSQRIAFMAQKRVRNRHIDIAWDWLGITLKLALYKTFAGTCLAFLRVLRFPLKLLGNLSRIGAVILPLVAVWAYFSHAKVASDFWQKGAWIEAYALVAAFSWAWLEIAFETAELKFCRLQKLKILRAR